MRITDLLDVRSISLNAAPADKSQTLDAVSYTHLRAHETR